MESNPDRHIFDGLVLENLAVLQRFAIRLTGDAERGEELAQETLLRATRSWQSFRGKSLFRTWLFQIAVNAFRDGLRKRWPDGAMPEGMVDANSAGPVASTEQSERGLLVARAVSSLPPRQREVMALHAFEQLSVTEVAGVLGITEGNVRSQLTYARKRLKELLAPYVDHQP